MNALTGTGKLLRAIIRYDWKKTVVWIVLISALSASSVLAYDVAFPDIAERRELSIAMQSNPSMSIIFGPARDLLTSDGFNAWRAGQLGALFAAIMATLLVTRNTRAQEDSGQGELVASGVVTRQARLIAPVLAGLLTATVLGVSCFGLTWLSGGEVLPSAIISAGYCASAAMFTSVSAVACQLGSQARIANTLSLSMMGIFYVIRGYIDSTSPDNWTLWLTPFGWIEKTAPATDHLIWPFIPCAIFSIVLLAVALILHTQRDFGFGFIRPRLGNPAAPKIGILALSWRIHRGSLISWWIIFGIFGFIFGNLSTSITSIFKDNPALAQMMTAGTTSETDLINTFIYSIFQSLGIMAAILGAQIATKFYSEELALRAEPLLATTLSRGKYLASNILFVYVGTGIAMAISGITFGLIIHKNNDLISILHVCEQALVTTSAVWVLNAIAVAAVAIWPRVRSLSWLSIVVAFAISILGPSFKLPNKVLGVSPFYHVTSLSTVAPQWEGTFVLLAIVMALTLLSFIGYRRRAII
ncbi:ABC transporter permease [Arcanobacterium ihumii]|uniref:ABC transporter permease n=1 Tax=Arcanobacterium ihumii TaxID=2138162 RepID=UPI000F51DB72|nr:multidrug ABC transporter permease [Arcanobacterium ihumii]